MRTRTGFLVTVLSAVALAVAACSGGPGGTTNDPVGTVNAAMAAAESGGFTALTEYMCQANKDDVTSAFGGGGDLGDLGAAGIDPDQLFDAVKFDFQDQTVTEVSRSDTEATVHLKGNMAMTFDAAAMRSIVKQILEAQGVEATDQMIDVAMSTMEDQLSQTQPIDTDQLLFDIRTHVGIRLRHRRLAAARACAAHRRRCPRAADVRAR